MHEHPDSAGACALILAAGKGTRMGSDLAKVLHPLAGRPLVAHVIAACRSVPAISRIVTVVGHQREAVAAVVQPLGSACAIQDRQLGTGHAVMVCRQAVHEPVTVVLCGDAPLVDGALLRSLLEHHARTGAACTAVAAHLDDPTGYGRMLTDETGRLKRIVEHRDATPEQRLITLVNAGLYAFSTERLFTLLEQLRPDNAQGEYYLTDVVQMLATSGEGVELVVSTDPTVVLGINTPQQLAECERLFLARERTAS